MPQGGKVPRACPWSRWAAYRIGALVAEAAPAAEVAPAVGVVLAAAEDSEEGSPVVRKPAVLAQVAVRELARAAERESVSRRHGMAPRFPCRKPKSFRPSACSRALARCSRIPRSKKKIFRKSSARPTRTRA